MESELKFTFDSRFRLIPGLFIWLLITLVLTGFLFSSIPEQEFDEGRIAVPFLFMLPLWGLAATILAGAFASLVWKRRSAVVLSYVEQAIRLQLPLSSAIMAAARGESGKVRTRLLSLHQRLETGASLPAALAAAVPELGSESVRAVGAAMVINQLPRALPRITARLLPRDPENVEMAGFYRGYFLVTLLLGVTLVVGLIQAIVLSKFKSVFVGFHTPLPFPATLLDSADATDVYLLGVLTLGLAALVLTFRRIREELIWRLPIIGRAHQARALADFCGFMIDAIESDRPVDEALALAAQAQSSAVLRTRILNWSQSVKNGQPLKESARAAKMPDLIASMLGPTRSSEDVNQVFAFLARHYQARFSRLEEIVNTLTVPTLALIMGAATLLVGLSLFQPLAELINAASRAALTPNGGAL